MKQKYIDKLEHIRECQEKNINPISKVDRDGNALCWDSYVEMISNFVDQTLDMKVRGKPKFIRVYNKSDPDYLDALEEIHPRLKELRNRWA